MAGEQTVEALLDSLTKLKEQLGTLRLDKDVLHKALVSGPPPAGANSLTLLDSLAAVREGSSQKVIIDIMLRQIAKQCRGCGMVLLGSGAATIWLGPGYGLGEEERAGSRKLPVSIQEDSLVRRAAATGDAIASSWPATESEEDIYRTIGMTEPSHIALIPMTINGRVQAVIIADVESGEIADPAALAIIVATAATTIEHLPFRDRIGYSRFPRIEGSSEPASQEVTAAPRPELVETPKVEEPQQAAPQVKAQEPAPEEPPVVEEPPAPEPTVEEPPAPEPTIEESPVPEPVVELPQPPAEIEEIQEDAIEEEASEEITEVDEPEVPQPTAATGATVDSYYQELEAELGASEEQKKSTSEEPAPMTEAADFDASEFEIEVSDDDVSDVLGDALEASSDELSESAEFDATDLDEVAGDMEIDFLESPEFTETPAPEIATGPTIESAREQPQQEEPQETEAPEPVSTEQPAAAAAEEKPSEQPVEINYEAFGLTGYDLEKFDGDTRKQHEKAIRFARLLVSEIKLYNEDAVKLGRQHSDLISRLKDDITRSEALYKQRISSEIREQSNYFHAEMVRQLAEGDEALLGE